jgi:hypothetical protein
MIMVIADPAIRLAVSVLPAVDMISIDLVERQRFAHTRDVRCIKM